MSQPNFVFGSTTDPVLSAACLEPDDDAYVDMIAQNATNDVLAMLVDQVWRKLGVEDQAHPFQKMRICFGR